MRGLQVDVRAGVDRRSRASLKSMKTAALALEAVTSGGEVVDADDHVLRRDGERLAMGRRLDVVGSQHEHAGLGLRLAGQRHMHGHLVAVEVGVERAYRPAGAGWMALPSTSTGSKAWMPRRCRVGARLSSTGWSVMTSSSTSQTSDAPRSTMRLAALILAACSSSTRRFMTKGLNSSRAICLGRPHW